MQQVEYQARKHTLLRMPCVCSSADEMPYFQCFFVDEDEAQFPFYAFSPLQMWSFGLDPVWGLQCSRFTDDDEVSSQPVLLDGSRRFPAGLPGTAKTGDCRRWTDFSSIPRFGWALKPNTCTWVSFLSVSFSCFLCVCFILLKYGRHEKRSI